MLIRTGRVQRREVTAVVICQAAPAARLVPLDEPREQRTCRWHLPEEDVDRRFDVVELVDHDEHVDSRAVLAGAGEQCARCRGAIGERSDPEALRALMNRYYDAARAVLERHGGTVEKFVGDAVMAVFGIPTASEDDALRVGPVRSQNSTVTTFRISRAGVAARGAPQPGQNPKSSGLSRPHWPHVSTRRVYDGP